jgi:spermidine synthase
MSRQTAATRATPAYSPGMTGPASPGSNRLLPLIVLLFIGSGAAALIYEVVWFQLLGLIVGSSTVSLAVILATFMGGMCLGSILLPKYVSRRHHPLKVYAYLEAFIGVAGLLVVFLLPYAGGLYHSIGGGGVSGLITRAIFCTIFLLAPTMAMGATLPAIARWVQTTPRGVAWMGFFYGGNIAGAVLGALLAGFYLLRAHDMMIATYAAVAINLGVAALAVVLSGKAAYHAGEVNDEEERATPLRTTPGAQWVYVAIGLSGLVGIAAQGVWTRLVTLLLGGTVYTFSLIVAVFLVGLGIGSTVGSTMAGSLKNPRLALGWVQLGVVAALAWAGWALMSSLPYWPINPALASDPSFTFQIDLIRCAYAILPAAILWGASFPLALAGVAEPGQDPGRLVGTVYAANTVGAIVGALLGSVVLIPWLGTQDAQRLLMALAAVSALVMLVPAMAKAGAAASAGMRGAVAGGITVAVSALLIVGLPQLPPLLVMYGRYMATWIGHSGEVVFVGEGMNSSMAVSRFPNGYTNYHNAGKVQASSEPQDMRLQRMLGHLTTLLPANPTSVLVIGCGAGVTAGAVSIDPAVQKVTIAEIEKLVPQVVSEHFGEYNFNVVRNPKTEVVIDDARHFLLTTDQKFDAITSDPFDPWVKGAATLYTKEFWELVKSRLNPGGVVTVFVQLYEAGTPAVKSEVATFLEVFPDAIIWGNTHQGRGYDVVMMAQNGPTSINVDAVQAKLQDPRYMPVARSLSEIGMYSAVDLFGTYAGHVSDMRPWLVDAQINRDRNLRLQFLAGLGMNKYEQAQIYADMLQYRRYPENLFTGTPETLSVLQERIFSPK